MSRERGQPRRGFTLVELIAAITVLAAMGSVVSVVLTSAIDGYTRASTSAQLHTELSIAIDRIDQFLRFIPYNGVSGPDVVSVTGSSITWQTDWSLELVGDELRLVEDGGPSRVLLEDVTDFSVQAFDQSNAGLAANIAGSGCDAIQRLQITVTQDRNGVSETLRTRVFIRGLAAGAEN